MSTLSIYITRSILIFYTCFVVHDLGAQQNDLEIIRNRIYNQILDSYSGDNNNLNSKVFDDLMINQILDDFDGEKWPKIHYSDVSREGFDNRIHLNNLVRMGVAYKNSLSKYYGDKTLIKKIIKGLQFWCENDFIGDNWWNNQIGTPRSMVELMLIVGEELPQKLITQSQVMINRADIHKGGSRPGGDRIKVSSIAAKNQLFLGDKQQFEEIIDIIENEIKYVNWIGNEFGYTYSQSNTGGFIAFLKANGRGLQYDNSFHHRTDGVNNTLSYGLNWASAFVEWAYYCRDTHYAFSAEKTKVLVDYYLDGVCKSTVFGIKPDYGVKNRSISRPGTTKKYDSKIPIKIVALTNYRKDEMNSIIGLRSGRKSEEIISHATFYWNSEHFTFQRPNFFTSVRLYSSRNMNMESPYNSEGLLNHHRGDGANHIYTSGDEYDDISPVLDYQKISGTTVVQKENLPPPSEIKKLGLTDFVGATTDGHYGVVGFDFKSIHDPLVVRKSWFFFDEQYVCLGSGISSKASNEVNTTLNQSLLNGAVTLSSMNKQQTLERASKVYTDVDWIHHDDVAYILPNSIDVSIQNDASSGSWWNISKQIGSSKETISKDIFKAWIDHGEKPDNASYEYIVWPKIKLDQLNSNKLLEPIEILSNTPYLQAVRHKKLGLLQAVFYKAGKLAVGKENVLEASAPCIVMIQMEEEDKIKKITVSDPNRELSTLYLKVSKKFEGSSVNHKSFWNPKQHRSEILIDLPQGGFAGQSVVIPYNVLN